MIKSNFIKSLTLVVSILITTFTGCKLIGNTMKLTDFFTPEMVTLIRAIEKDNEAKASALINKGLSLNMHGDEGITPLYWLAIQKDKKAMRLAIKLGADPDFTESKGGSLVAFVAGADDNELLLILLESGADPNGVNSNGRPALFSAIGEERMEQIKMLIRFGADINLTDKRSSNSAMYASLINKFEIVHFLIEHGVDYTAYDQGGADIAWNIHNRLSKNLLSPEFPAYSWALKVKQQLLDRGVKFPPPSPRDIRFKEGRPNEWDIEAREKERENK